MLRVGSFFIISDNSGAKKVQCIKVLKKHPKSAAFLGDFVIVSVKELRSKGNLKVKKKDVCLGLIFRTKYKTKRFDGRAFNFFSNSVILLNKSLKLRKQHSILCFQNTRLLEFILMTLYLIVK